MDDFDVMEGVDTTPQPKNAIGASPDDALLVKFYLEAIEDKAASKEAGRPVFRDEEMISIRFPGSRNEVVRVARNRDRQRFPRHYAAFKQRVSNDHVEGTPLTEWPQIKRSQVETLAFLNVKTVEQLAQVPDNSISGLMGGYGLKEQARKWLEKASGIEALQEKLQEKDAQIEALTARLDALEMEQKQPGKVGRKKKVESDQE